MTKIELKNAVVDMIVDFIGYSVNVPIEDQESLVVNNGDSEDGECFHVEKITPEGCYIDDGDFYTMDELSKDELQMLFDYLMDKFK